MNDKNNGLQKGLDESIIEGLSAHLEMGHQFEFTMDSDTGLVNLIIRDPLNGSLKLRLAPDMLLEILSRFDEAEEAKGVPFN